MKDRLPLIVTRIVDFLARHRANIVKQYGDVSYRCFLRFTTDSFLSHLQSLLTRPEFSIDYRERTIYYQRATRSQ